MGVAFEPFTPDHLFHVKAQAAQGKYLEFMTQDIAEAAAAHYAITARADGEIVGCAGVAPTEAGDFVAWAVFSDLIQKYPVAIYRAVQRTIDLFSTERVLMHIHPEHGKAARFAEALNFRFLEARADLHPSGALLHVYVREGV